MAKNFVTSFCQRAEHLLDDDRFAGLIAIGRNRDRKSGKVEDPMHSESVCSFD